MVLLYRGASGTYRVHFGMRRGIVRAGHCVCSFGNYLVIANDEGGEWAALSGFDVLYRQFYCSRYVGIRDGKVPRLSEYPADRLKIEECLHLTLMTG